MIDHIELSVGDAARALAFYGGALKPLGYALVVAGESNGFGTPDGRLDFWLRPGGPSTPRPHVAFQCASRELVDAAHGAALSAGGADNGAPSLITRIAPDYYAAFVHDPDGHNIEFVARG
jgi:catechol 2,3-dioxygenase-like lactoylglutathione lyase family enzyme